MHTEIGVVTQTKFMVNILMYPFNENFTFDPLPDSTWIGLMKYRVKYLARYGLYAEYRRNPQDYRNRYRRFPEYIKYVEEDFPRALKMTDNELRWYPEIDRTQWDGYVIGGLYENDLLLKSGHRANVAKISQIDWEGMQNLRKPYILPYNQLSCREQACYKNQQDYILTESSFITWTVLDELGWHEVPSKGYSISCEDAASWSRMWYKRFIQPRKQEDLFTVVDIHD